MNIWQPWFSRKKKWEQDMQDELRFHIERQTAANIAAGLPPEEARRQAVLQLGALEGVKENCREQRRGFWLESLYADVRFGLRMLLKNWRLTSVAVFSLAVAMAVSVAGLSVFNAVLLRPPAVVAPDRLVTIYTRSPAGEFENVSYPDYKFYRDNNQVFSGVAAFPNSVLKLDVTIGDRDEPATISSVSDNYFAVTGIRPALGQMFSPGDDNKKMPGAVLSYSCWKRLGGEPGIIGKTLTFRRHRLTILGVAPRNFPGTVFGFASDVFITLATAADIFQDPGSLTDRGQRGLLLLARLKPNATNNKTGGTPNNSWATSGGISTSKQGPRSRTYEYQCVAAGFALDGHIDIQRTDIHHSISAAHRLRQRGQYFSGFGSRPASGNPDPRRAGSDSRKVASPAHDGNRHPLCRERSRRISNCHGSARQVPISTRPFRSWACSSSRPIFARMAQCWP